MEFNLLKDILIIFALSTFVNYIFTRIKIPTIVGYLLTGILAGPHLAGFVHSEKSIEMLAEIGVVLLLFTIGLEFSLKHLIKIRRIVFWGGFMQVAVTTIVVTSLAVWVDFEFLPALFVGFITALSSTAVVLKVLQDRNEISSNYGRTVLGILIFQDIMLVPLLLFTPFMGGQEADFSLQFLYLGLKSVAIIGVVFVGNKWVMPKLLHAIAMTRNQELFFMSILLICLSVAFLTHEMGMSLAFGAFLAGLMISESEYSHNAFGHIIPFKDIFTSFFFVSIGMMLDLSFVGEHIVLVSTIVLVVIGIKMLIAGITGFVLGHTLRGFILVGLALSQVGEFSFILVQMGLGYNILSPYYYQLFLAVAVTTMALTPFSIMLARPLSTWIMTLPLPKILINGAFPLQQVPIPEMNNHLVVIGKDSRAESVSSMARQLKMPVVSIVFDPAKVKQRQQTGEAIVYGDAINDPILKTAHVNSAEIVVISIGDLITALSVTERVRQMNKHACIFVRTPNVNDIEELYKVGATQVIPEEFETAIDMFERILNKYLIPQGEIRQIVGKVRKNNYGALRDHKKHLKTSVLKELPNIEISALKVGEKSPLTGHGLAELDFRNRIGVTIVAIKRDESLIDRPDGDTILKKGDIVYVLGTPDEIATAIKSFSEEKVITT